MILHSRAGLRRPGRCVGLVAVTALIAVAGCQDDEPDAAPPICDNKEDLEASLEALADVEVLADGTDALRSATQSAGTAMSALAESANDEVEDEVDAVQAAYADVEEAVESLGDGAPPSDQVAAISSALEGLAASVGTLSEELDQDCG